MPNMSYCRFENTLRDLKDCVDHIGDAVTSKEEAEAMIRLVKTCVQIAEDYGEDFADLSPATDWDQFYDDEEDEDEDED